MQTLACTVPLHLLHHTCSPVLCQARYVLVYTLLSWQQIAVFASFRTADSPFNPGPDFTAGSVSSHDMMVHVGRKHIEPDCIFMTTLV